MGKKQQTGINACRMWRCRQQMQGFTLVEILIAIAVIGILSSLTVMAVGKAKTHADSTRSVTAAKALISAFLLYSTENNATLFPGYDATAGGSNNQVWYRDRLVTSAEAPHRYPFRLATYLNDEFQGSIWVGNNYEQLNDMSVFSGGFRDYGISLFPAFGMNYHMVGGRIEHSGAYSEQTAQEAALNHYDLESQLIVFASAGQRGSDYGVSKHRVINGYHEIKPPNLYGSSWATTGWSQNSNPANFGNIDPRFDGKAIVAFTDGSVRLMSIDEMRDMRLWSRKAAEMNDRGYMPTYTPKFEL